MAKFKYNAKDQKGNTQKGYINASNKEVALNSLQSHGLTVVDVVNVDKKPFLDTNLSFFDRVSARDLVIFARLLATLLEVEVPLTESLSILAKQQKNKFFKETLYQIVNDVQDGSLLSEALAKHDKVFSQLFVAMVQSGEISGGLQGALLFMADYLEEQYELNNQIRGAMMYPIFVIVIFLVIGLGIAYMVLPQLVEVLRSLDAGKLPLSTSIIIFMSDFLQEYVWYLLALVVFGFLGMYLVMRTESGKMFWDRWQLKLPIFGDLFTKIYVARFAINMHTLLKGGIPILISLKISANVVGNRVYAGIIRNAIKEIKDGSDMSSAFIKYKEFPSVASQIIRVGEKTGKIDSVLKTLANFYRKEVDVLIRNMTSLIEPVMIVVLGIGIGIFVVSILMPIYNIAGAL
jgi:type IV pilus assembly protein PilC